MPSWRGLVVMQHRCGTRSPAGSPASRPTFRHIVLTLASGLFHVARTQYIYTQSHTHVLVDLYFRSLSRNNLGAVRPCVLQGKNWMEFYMRPEAEMGKVAPEPPVEPKEKDWATFTKIIYTIYFHKCSFLFGCTHGMFKV